MNIAKDWKDYKILDITIPLKDVFAYMEDENFMKNVDDILIEIGETSYSLTGKRWPKADIVGDFKETLPCAPNSMVISVYSQDLQKNVQEIVNSSENYRYRSWMMCGEFYGAHFSKREGVMELLKYHNKTKDDLIFFGDAENEIGRVCVQLASPDFKYMTGETITLEGGLGLRP